MKFRVFWIAVLLLISFVQIWFFYTWARPRFMELYTSPLSINSLDPAADTRIHTVLRTAENKRFINISYQHFIYDNKSEQYGSNSSFHPVHRTPYPLPPLSLADTLRSDTGHSWKPGTFCDDFLERRYHTAVPICGPLQESDQVKCRWNPSNAHAAVCDIDNVMIQPGALWSAMESVNSRFPGSESIWLLEIEGMSCPRPSISILEHTTEGGDYVKKLTEDVLKSRIRRIDECQHWINETVFFFSSHAHHIYFRFLAYYSVFKSLLDHKVDSHNYRIFRLSEGYNYIFPDYEKALFPNSEVFNSLKNIPTCFRKVVLVPKCYASVLFQCKMQKELLQQCFECNGKALTGTPLMSFRRRVLAACGLQDWQSKDSEKKLLTLILRKPYTRWKGDHPNDFQRVLTNSEELTNALIEAFPNTNIKPVHMEDLTICEQISYTHNADVLIGVHGAGLVHLWWLRNEALIVELEPFFEQSNPSFKMLSKLTGRQYQGISIMGGSGSVIVDVQKVIQKVKEHSNLT